MSNIIVTMVATESSVEDIKAVNGVHDVKKYGDVAVLSRNHSSTGRVIENRDIDAYGIEGMSLISIDFVRRTMLEF